MCWFKMKHQMDQCRVEIKEKAGEQLEEEGLLSWHARVRDDSAGIFLHTLSGRIAMI